MRVAILTRSTIAGITTRQLECGHSQHEAHGGKSAQAISAWCRVCAIAKVTRNPVLGDETCTAHVHPQHERSMRPCGAPARHCNDAGQPRCARHKRKAVR